MDELNEFFKGKKIAYFSMEMGLQNEIPTYSGGLGILAGDVIRASADLGIPLVGVTLVSRKGHFAQHLDEKGRQSEDEQKWSPEDYIKLLPAEVTVRIQQRDVRVRAWLYEHKSLTEELIPVILLDTDVDGNSPEDRGITDYLYGGDSRYRLKQEIILGIGGAKMLDKLGLHMSKYHMNEGHSSLLTMELLRRNEMDPGRVKELCVFTTHTPVASGHDRFSYDLVRELIEGEQEIGALRKYGGEDELNMTVLALNLSDYINGVAKRHREISEKMFPGYKFRSITNGVHSYTWVCSHFRVLYDRHIPGWANEPELLVRVKNVPGDEIWDAHKNAKKELIDHVNMKKGIGMDHDTLTIGFARRMAEYKRPAFIFSDLKRLMKVNEAGKIQLIFAGKAHPADTRGKEIIEEIFGYIEDLKDTIKIAFLENYDMDLALKMVSGVDVWLNTPKRPFEASGTSGMKAAHNGVVNLSVPDGWWIEGCVAGVTGYSIGAGIDPDSSPEEIERIERDDLYNKLEYIIIPKYYDRRDEWIAIMRNSVEMIAYYFNCHRMMRRYVTEAYL
ncbi:alpha-glucan family phosphorylase [Methanolobus halotolerans]|uniref:Alpha-glucan family phosphorylase n=1 Tax=Methanolobus halotolerans TaxID=2052935 RepID=A0A4E0PYU8_9EURY|nr:alpha-glucan family phosphorylase [Methanolobus halotolerans]TGC11522.1 alpha-glucan family phosphorylase [Methanolobus halotolerans]